MSGAVDPEVEFVEFVAGASPTGLAGFTSSKGAVVSAFGADFGGGPKSVSGVGVGDGAGFTRRGREDCALRDIAAMNKRAIAKSASRNFSGLGIRFFIERILSDFQQNLQTMSRKLSSLRFEF